MTTHLPIVGSTAKTTSFCSARIDGPGGRHLFFDGNGKITAGNGTLHEPRPNAFSLLQIDDCPYHTDTCGTACYVHNLEKAQPELYALYQHNSATIREILDDGYDALEWARAMGAWITENAPAGFRWHVSGDVFSFAYAQFIADVVRASPTVRHWIYTRSFPIASPLLDVCTERGGNLSLNLSCDRDNIEMARAFKRDNGAGRLCYLVVEGDTVPADVAPDGVTFPDYALRPRQFATLAESPWWHDLAPELRGTVCPVDAHGKAENRRCGPCDRCMR